MLYSQFARNTIIDEAYRDTENNLYVIELVGKDPRFADIKAATIVIGVDQHGRITADLNSIGSEQPTLSSFMMSAQKVEMTLREQLRAQRVLTNHVTGRAVEVEDHKFRTTLRSNANAIMFADIKFDNINYCVRPQRDGVIPNNGYGMTWFVSYDDAQKYYKWLSACDRSIEELNRRGHIESSIAEYILA